MKITAKTNKTLKLTYSQLLPKTIFKWSDGWYMKTIPQNPEDKSPELERNSCTNLQTGQTDWFDADFIPDAILQSGEAITLEV